MNSEYLFPHRLTRRDFLKMTAASAAALAVPKLARAADAPVKIGEGKWTYTLDESWGQLPAGMSYGLGCGIRVDSKDRVYVTSRSTSPSGAATIGRVSNATAPCRRRAAASMTAWKIGAAPVTPVEDLSELRAQLDAKEREVKDLEAQKQRRVADAEARLTELRSKFTAAHPMVAAAEANVASLAADTPQLGELRAQAAGLAATLKAKSAANDLLAQGGPKVAYVPPSSGTPGSSGLEPLPAENPQIMRMSWLG